MVTEKTAKAFAQAQADFTPFPSDRAWLAAALARGQGAVFVGDGVMLFYPEYGALSFMAGDTDSPALPEVMRHYLAQIRQRQPSAWFLSVPSAQWRQRITDLFAREFVEVEILSYTLDHQRFLSIQQQTQLPDGFRVCPVDAELARRIAEIDDEFKLFWQPDDFAVHGVGYCVLQGEQLASVAYSVFPPTDSLVLEVATAPAFRGQGLAAIPCIQLIQECLSNNSQPLWSTAAINQASRSVAQKLGFEHTATQWWLMHTLR